MKTAIVAESREIPGARHSKRENPPALSRRAAFFLAVCALSIPMLVPQFAAAASQGEIQSDLPARNAADRRNVQLWNETYLNAVAVGADMEACFHGRSPVMGRDVAAIDVSVDVCGNSLRFCAPAFTLQGDGNLTFSQEKGLVWVVP